jgi:hypothetical protein
MDKHRRIGFPKDANYLEELRATPPFSWAEFVDGLIPIGDDVGTSLKSLLAQLRRPPSVYWYPGSGDDLRPLVLDVPNNALGRRLFRTSSPDLEGDPVIFWMNDYYHSYAAFPNLGAEASEVPYPPAWLPEEERLPLVHRWDQWFGWGRYESTLKIAEQVERYVFRDRLPITLFTVNVKNIDQGKNNRPAEGDTYLVVFSNVPSHVLFEEAILPLRLNVTCVLLAKQGGFAGEICNYNQYEQIPTLVRAFEPELGPVDLYLIDMSGQDDHRRPRFEVIQDYEYVGGPVPLGWSPCRAFGRPGLRYELERKPPGYVGKKKPW